MLRDEKDTAHHVHCVMEISVEKSELLNDQRVNLPVVRALFMYIV
jgi:hypothetical protein